MGAGASIPADKLEQFQQKLLILDSMNEAQKQRLLELMASEVKKLMPSDDMESKAASKIQALCRGKTTAANLSSGLAVGETLEQKYNAFCSTYRQTQMTNTVFAKFCKDAKLICKLFSVADIDMTWAKIAGKAKKVDYPEFVKLLEIISAKKGLKFAELESQVLIAQVTNSGTKGESRFYDDKSLWTGSAAVIDPAEPHPHIMITN